jgi:hypothetical protein
MSPLLKALFQKRSAKVQKDRPRVRPELESLEQRWVPTVTYHGGPVMPNVEVQGLYLGSDWWYNSTYYSQTGYLEGSMNSLVHGSYMDMLNNAGYGVGRGSFDGGWVNGVSLDKTHYLSDGAIRNYLMNNINAGNLKQPDGNRLYVIYVEPGVAVGDASSNSVSNFLGYHDSFVGFTFSEWFQTIRYAVIPYAGSTVPLSSGTVTNATRWWLNQLDTTTLTVSHELAEAVTDPDPRSGWDDTTPGMDEIGDIANAQTVRLNGYAVQRESDKNDQGMTPAGATSVNQVNFVLRTDGNLYMSSSSGLTWLSGGIASLSDQSIDNYGHAMVDVVTTGGAAYEYHEGIGWTYLDSNVKSAKAGQGVSYLLYNSGTVYEYKDWASSHWTYIDSNVTSIDAGTDRYGVSMMTEVWYGQAWEHSDSTGWHYIDTNVKSVSAGQQGIIDLLYTNGNAYWYNESTSTFAFLGSGVSQITAGTDQYGNYMIDMLYNSGDLYEYRTGSGWTWLDNGVVSIGKGHNGVTDMVFSWGDAYDHDSSGWHYLTYNAKTAA